MQFPKLGLVKENKMEFVRGLFKASGQKPNAATLRARVAELDRCLLCAGSPTTRCGVFRPTIPEHFGGDLPPHPGKTRIATYALCESCITRHTRSGMLETAIISEIEQSVLRERPTPKTRH